MVVLLREKCLFTAPQVTDILRESPAIVLEDLAQVEFLFQVSSQSKQERNETVHTYIFFIIYKIK